MNNVFYEGNLRFDFAACGKAERFDEKNLNSFGMKAVDFIVETADCLYFIEVKDFQNPNAPTEQQEKDLEMLIAAANDQKAVFNLEMGEKIKDSLLRKYAEGSAFSKKVMYILFINLEGLGEKERGLLKDRIKGHVPTGLNDARFNAFTEISFDLVNTKKKLMEHGIVCEDKSVN